jgi:hypothetical protein
LPPCCESSRAEGVVQAILDSVRGNSNDGATEQSPPPDSSPSNTRQSTAYSSDSEDSGNIFVGLVLAAGFCATSPFWGPVVALDDDYSWPAFFPRFPYDDVDGHLSEGLAGAPQRPWSGRFNFEYLEPFTDANGITGRVLLSTTSRFGLDLEASHFDERRTSARPESLWVGDCNVVFRFAQSEKAEFRAGLGFNWLDHPDPAGAQTDFGFNFTYGADFFPRKPWVFSAELDAGNLGRAGLFRFRTTGGILLRGIEAYTGYEYLDIGRGHFNVLLAGVRAWF